MEYAIRDLKLFCVLDDDWKQHIEVTAIHDGSGYQAVREELADQYNLSKQEPNIQVHEVDLRGDRSITLHHIQRDQILLAEDTAKEVMKHLRNLWKFDVHVESFQDGKSTAKFVCDDEWLKTEKVESGADARK